MVEVGMKVYVRDDLKKPLQLFGLTVGCIMVFIMFITVVYCHVFDTVVSVNLFGEGLIETILLAFVFPLVVYATVLNGKMILSGGD